MALTLKEIVEETRNWPPELIGELVGLLTEDLHASDPAVAAAWKREIARRIDEIQAGKTNGVSPENVATRINRILGR